MTRSLFFFVLLMGCRVGWSQATNECAIPFCGPTEPNADPRIRTMMTCRDTRPQYCIDKEMQDFSGALFLAAREQKVVGMRWELDHPRYVMPPRADWNPKMCSVPRIRVSEEYVDYCAITRSGSADCVLGYPNDNEEQVMSTLSAHQSAYLELDDCLWHVGENPREFRLHGPQLPIPKELRNTDFH